MTGAEIVRVELQHDEDVVVARQRARDVAELLGLDALEQTRIATAVSELARNARRYGGGGLVRIGVVADALVVDVIDHGPGIADLDAVLEGRYRSASGMGRGLIGVRLLMDEFSIDSSPGQGTHVHVTKSLPPGLPRREPHSVRDELLRRGARTPYDEVTRQNEELLQALGEVRARQQELVALNRELEATNRGVLALYGELDDRAEQLRDAGERKSRFLADMSHELRTPLNSILALTELLIGGGGLDPEQVRQIEFIRRTAEEQLRLVGDLLDIARIEAGRVELTPADVSVAELFAVLRGQLQPLLGDRDVRLRFDAGPGLPVVHADEDRLLQVLRNVIGNALEFTIQGEVVVSAEVEDAAIVFRVRDTGIGIAVDDIDRVFAEFVQVPGELQSARQGTGLGLPLSRNLIRAMGGEIELESDVGVGTVATVRLPLRRSIDPVDEEGPGDLTGSVLLVDDDETSRYVVSAHLRDTAWPVRVATSGEMALAALEHSRPAAVILDLAMPDLDGIEVLRRLRADPSTASLPVLIHTSRLLEAEQRRRIERLEAQVLDKSTTSRSSLLEALAASTGRPLGD